MFILDLITYRYFDYIIYGLLLIGVFSFIMSKALGVYAYIAKPISALVVVASVFVLGTIYSQKAYNAEIERFRERVRVAEENSQKTNIEIQTRVVERVKVVKETTNANIQYIDRVVTKYDNLCTLSNAVISVHNSASQNEVSRSTGSSIEGTSNVKVSDLIRTVTENYGTYYEVREQLLGWQQWYREQRKIHEGIR